MHWVCKIFMLKNMTCGFLAVSPLIGASLLGSNTMQQQLMVEDVEVDRGVKQAKTPVSDWYSEFQTYSVWYNQVNAALIFSTYYWKMFVSHPSLYAISVTFGTPMCILASRLQIL